MSDAVTHVLLATGVIINSLSIVYIITKEKKR